MRHVMHLASRFFRSLSSRRPGVDAQRLVAGHLSTEEAGVFWRQPVPDLDHALRGASHLAEVAPGRDDLVRAFLLHDVGKRASRLGTWRRALVTGLSLLRLPVGRRGRMYLDHAAIGAVELDHLGCERLVVAFAAGHHGHRPSDLDPADWDLLLAADRR